MRRDWPAEARSFQLSVEKALTGVGAVGAARAAEADPGFRARVIRPLLDSLGVCDLDPWGEQDEAAALVLAVRSAGAVALPWPLNHQLAVPLALRGDVDAVYLGAPDTTRLEHADQFANAVLAEGFASSAFAVRPGELTRVPLDPFGVAVAVDETHQVVLPPGVAVMHHVLDAFWISGAVRSMVDIATRHARDRQQFGTAIGRFGEVRTMLADLVLARDGLDELALYTWWLARAGRATPTDALALRLHGVESATASLMRSHQVLAAMGLCEEHDLAVIDRHLQPLLRRPGGVHRTARCLAATLPTDGFDAIYPVAGWRS